MGSYGIVCDGEDRVSPISWTIFHWEEVYYLFFLLDNQCLMCAILSLIHFQLIPYFKKKAIQSVFTLIAQTSYPEQTKKLIPNNFHLPALVESFKVKSDFSIL